jgi:purine-nucleoside phosphorylase
MTDDGAQPGAGRPGAALGPVRPSVEASPRAVGGHGGDGGGEDAGGGAGDACGEAVPLPRRIDASLARLRAAGVGPGAAAPFPAVAVVAGSGWDALAPLLEDPQDIAYAELPAFPRPGVHGHAALLRLGRLTAADGTALPLALLRGRAHAYEHGDTAAMKGAIRTLAAAGCRTLVLTNAAGSLDPALPPGRLMLLADHLNLVQRTPLHVVPADDPPGLDRFVSLVDAYDPALRALARAAAAEAGLPLREGVYAWMLGPQFETPAEIRMLQRLGADAVGMSTVPETILARQCGLRVLGLSMITNLGAGLDAQALSHAHTLAQAQAGAADALRLLRALLPRLVAEAQAQGAGGPEAGCGSQSPQPPLAQPVRDPASEP